MLTEKIARLERAELLAMLDEVDVPVGPVNDVAEILGDPHVRARRLVGSFDYPGVGEFKALAIPYKFLGWDNPEIGRPPALGEHTESVLSELLGFRRRDLRAEGGQGDMTDRMLRRRRRGDASRSIVPRCATRSTSRCATRCWTLTKRSLSQEIRLVFVRGNGPVFCGGADLNERKGKSEEWIRARRMRAFAAYGALESLPMPCVALVHGAAIGSGVEIAAACDFIVATPDATFRTPEAQRGTVGATQRLPRILGKRLAKDLMFTGRALTADEARDAGFVARISADLESEKRRSPKRS